MKFVIFFDSRSQYSWHLKAANGYIIANGESYTAKQNAVHCINLVKGTTSASQYTVYQDTAGQWRWKLVATNGEIIAKSSEGYWNKADAENGVRLAVSTDANTSVEDLTLAKAAGY
jgi:uncharacterized protein YegP (UPF0339 family)